MDGVSAVNAMDEIDLTGDKRKELAWMEYKITCLCEIMMDIVTATRRHAFKQQTRTMEEKEMELYEEEHGTNQDDGGEPRSHHENGSNDESVCGSKL